MIETITFNNRTYPKLQSEGFASQYAFAFAEKFCKGNGVDVGYSSQNWMFPRALSGIDLGRIHNPTGEVYDESFSATSFPPSWSNLDFVFSSHVLEHLPDWVGVLDYWKTKLRPGGVCFLYLPNCDYQEYWRPFSNRKHINWLQPHMLESYFNSGGWRNVFVTQGYDLNGSFYAVAEKV